MPLLDDQKNSRMDVTGSGYLRQWTIAPVKDVEAFGKKQTLGSVVAYDPAKRALLVEYGSVARNDWKDATFLNRQVTARKARFGLEERVKLLSKEHPASQVVCLHLRGDYNRVDSDGLRKKTLALLDGPPDKRECIGFLAESEGWASGFMAVIAPVIDLEALTKKIDFATVIFYDTEHNVLILELPEQKIAK